MPSLKFVYSDTNPHAPVAFCSFTAMHTGAELLFVHDDRNMARAIAGDIQDIAVSLDHVFNRHLETNQLHSLNTSTEPLQLDEELFFALELCEQLRLATGGYFDIAALSSTLERPSYRMFPPSHQAQRTSSGILIDFGGFAKGYAAEKIRKTLREKYGVKSALLNFGSSSVSCIGTHPLGDYWGVSSENSLVQFSLRDSALSVSGLSRTGTDHIIDPHTGTMARSGPDIAVTGPSALLCEVLSTALYACPRGDRASIIGKFENYKIQEI
ncbi:MAG: FAD:protein FMN transferase [Bacteroidales bacterium]|nr:FAD:protein FMN transferase [Bacteroidales bacterium]